MTNQPNATQEPSDLFVKVEFDTAALMRSIRHECGGSDVDSLSLREIAAMIDVSASTLSRIDNGFAPDMRTFCTICGELNLMPERYFKRTLWQRVPAEGGAK